MTIREHRTGEGIKIDAWQPDDSNNIYANDFDKWNILKKMATSDKTNPNPELHSNYKIIEGKKVYSSEESERIAKLRLASGASYREAIGSPPINYVDIPATTKQSNEGYYFNYNNNNNNNDNNGRVKNTDLPLMLKIKMAHKGPDSNSAGMSRKKDTNVLTENELADFETAQSIANDLKSNELSLGQELSGQHFGENHKDTSCECEKRHISTRY
jgi:hypothetical protein